MTTSKRTDEASKKPLGARVARFAGPVIGFTLFVLAGLVLHRELDAYRPSQIIEELEAISNRNVFLAVLTAFGSYLAVTSYDALAMRSIGKPLHYLRTTLASFVATTFSNSMGFGLITGGSVRFRLYSAWDVSIEEISRVLVFFSVTLWLGFALLAGTVFSLESIPVPNGYSEPLGGTRTLGIVLLVLAVTYMTAATLVRKPIVFRGTELRLPHPRYLPAQIVVSILDWSLAGATLYLLMPPDLGLSFFHFLGFYLLALTGGMISQVPGGVGVFESLILLLLKNHLAAPRLIGVLLAYRAIYYLFPLLFGIMLMAGHELHLRRKGIKEAVESFGRWSALITPPILSFATLLAGVVLLVSGATPPAWDRIHAISRLLPISFIEGSHFLGSVAGIGLVLLSRGIQRRVDAAYVASAILLAAGIVFSLLKGWDHEEAIVLMVVLVALLPARHHFSRTSVLVTHTFSPGWVVATVAVLAGTAWLTVFSHSYVQYTNELWWQFELNRSAPRSMRALVGAITIAVGAGGAVLFSPRPRPEPISAAATDWQSVASIVRASANTIANLVFLGDKQILFSDEGGSFLMYGVAGRNYVSMGDPIGNEREWKPLAWKFREMADRAGANAAFYEVRPDNLPLYLDMGLSVLKFGEEARVPLGSFSLDGAARKAQRYVMNKLTREGCEFVIVEGAQLAAVMPELRIISDTWLSSKSTREKSFSLGSFSEPYLKHFPVGVVRVGGRIVAFANLWAGDNLEEVAIDLMRHADDAPQGVMDYLFVQLMLWAKARGVAWFNLGMAPLAGLDEHPMAPMWNRAGAFLFRHGEHFYNFQGLRSYKQKFDPVWQPKYIASPGGLAVASVLTSLATLSSGSVVGMVAKT